MQPERSREREITRPTTPNEASNCHCGFGFCGWALGLLLWDWFLRAICLLELDFAFVLCERRRKTTEMGVFVSVCRWSWFPFGAEKKPETRKKEREEWLVLQWWSDAQLACLQLLLSVVEVQVPELNPIFLHFFFSMKLWNCFFPTFLLSSPHPPPPS
jgi:hypothetical protein